MKINGVSIENCEIESLAELHSVIGRNMKLVTEKTGKKPDYLVVTEEQAETISTFDSSRIKKKGGELKKVDGMSVIVTPNAFSC